MSTTMDVALTFTEHLLGTQPGNPELLATHIAKRAGHEASEEELAALDTDEQVAKQSTVFPRDADGRPFLYDYQIKGFFKDACGMLRRIEGTVSAGKALRAFKKIIDGLVFVAPRRILLELPNGAEIGVCERPLRAQTPQGERVSISRSEAAPEGTRVRFSVIVLDDALLDAVQEWLEYGVLRGLGQWRNSGAGRFTFEMEEAKPDAA